MRINNIGTWRYWSKLVNEKFTSGMARRARVWVVFAAIVISVAAQPALQADQADDGGLALDELADAADETFAVLGGSVAGVGPSGKRF